MSRGRPSEQPAVVKQKRVETYYEELGWKSVWHYDLDKSKFGPWKTEHIPPKGWKAPKIKTEKGKAYNKQPVVMVFKTSNRSNAKIKIKVWRNENIDYILTAPKLPGIPDKAKILHLSVGENFIKSYKLKYNL